MTKSAIMSGGGSCRQWLQQLALLVLIQMTAGQKFFMDGAVGCSGGYGIKIEDVFMECSKEKYQPECEEEDADDCYDQYGNYKYDFYQDEQIYNEIDDEWKKDAPCYFDNYIRLAGQLTNNYKLPTNVEIVPRICHSNGYSCTDSLAKYMYVNTCDYLEGGECPYSTSSYFDFEMFMPQTYLTYNLFQWAKERQEQLKYNMGWTEEDEEQQEQDQEYAEEQYQEDWACDSEEEEEEGNNCDQRQELHDCEDDEDPEETGCIQRAYAENTVGTVTAKFLLRVEIRPIQDISIWSRMWDATLMGMSWADYQQQEEYDGSVQEAQQVDQYYYEGEQGQYQYEQYGQYQQQQNQNDDYAADEGGEGEEEEECPEDDDGCIQEQQQTAQQAYQRMIYNYMNEPSRSIYCHIPFRLVPNEYNVTSYKKRNSYYTSWFYKFINNMLSDCQITWTCNASEVEVEHTYYYASSVGALALLGGIFSIYRKKRRLATQGAADEAFVADGDLGPDEGTIEFMSAGKKSQRPEVIDGDSYVTMS